MHWNLISKIEFGYFFRYVFWRFWLDLTWSIQNILIDCMNNHFNYDIYFYIGTLHRFVLSVPSIFRAEQNRLYRINGFGFVFHPSYRSPMVFGFVYLNRLVRISDQGTISVHRYIPSHGLIEIIHSICGADFIGAQIGRIVEITYKMPVYPLGVI